MHAAPAGLALALLLVALNLRLPIACVGPVMEDIRATFGLSATVGGALTTLPVVCFGVFAGLAPLVTRGRDPTRALAACLIAIVAGAVVRSGPTAATLFAGTLLIGVAIAVGNVLVPAVIRGAFPTRIGVMTGGLAMGLNGGAAIAAAATVPVAATLGGGWRSALAAVALPALLALAVLLPHARRSPGRPRGGEMPERITGPWRDARTWQLAAFMGLQSLLYYAVLAWLPEILRGHGYAPGPAGAILGVFNLVGLATSLTVPVLAARRPSQRALGCALSAAWAAGLLGLLAAPGAAGLWAVLMGLAQGGTIGLALALIALRARSGQAAALSGLVQTAGYLIAAAGPLVVGGLHDVTGTWTAPLVALVLLVVPMTAAVTAAGRPGPIG